MSEAVTLILLAWSVGAAPSTPASKIPKDRVLVEICEEGIPPTNAWPTDTLASTENYSAPAFGFTRFPQKYIDTGLRADRPNPFLLRATARVRFPAGTHRLLLRGRGAARLLVDERQLLKTGFPPSLGDGSDGRDPSKDPYLDLGPDFRFAPPGNREAWTKFTTSGGEHRIVLETIVGGRIGKTGYRRPELGETVAAVSFAGETSFSLIGPGKAIAYTDATWPAYVEEERLQIDVLDAERRAAALRSEWGHWEKRREEAKQWLASTLEVKVPALAAGFPAHNAIDHFLAEKLAGVRAWSGKKGKISFSREVKPILEARCFSCHQGKKARGDLRLDVPSAAVVPGKPDQSSLVARILSREEGERMPPKGKPLTEDEVRTLKEWIREGGLYTEPPGRFTPLSDDLTFLRRVTLDTIGMVPSEDEVKRFLSEPAEQRRGRAIERLLVDPRRAGHWVGYWQDVLAENPNILNPTLNNTGPFRWWLHEAFLDNKPFDVLVTELVRMRGSERGGGPAGFGVASENDVPMAEKGVLVAAAFLGVNMKCARCHDAPAHRSTQRELFQLAAMLAGKPLVVPKTSSVPVDKLHVGGRPSLIKVTLKPGAKVDPAWPFGDFLKAATEQPAAPTSRERLAQWLTDPGNERFAQVVVNRVWQRLMGRGLVDPVDDWERGTPSHPELLRYLAREFVRSGYDLRQVERLILQSHAYQRHSDPDRTEPDAYFSAPVRRRMSAEQVVDSLFAAVGKPMNVGEISLDIDGGRDLKNSISMGNPRRAWEFASTSNERDRPSLSLPRVQAVADVLTAFGWRASRPDSTSTRDHTPDVSQPSVLANGTVAVWVTRLSEDHGITRLAMTAQTPESLVESLFVRILTRKPTAQEREALVRHLSPGFSSRLVTDPPKPELGKRVRPRYVSWSNHLTPEANVLKTEFEAAARRGDPPTRRLAPEWRGRVEDVLWALLNAPEFVYLP